MLEKYTFKDSENERTVRNKKNLRSVGNYIERMNPDENRDYISPFNGFVFDNFAHRKGRQY